MNPIAMPPSKTSVRRSPNPGTQGAGQVLWDQGLASVQEGDWLGAAHAFKRATKLVPNDSLYWLNLANAQRHLGRFDDAIHAARQCVKLDRTQFLAQRLLAESLLHQHKYGEACTVFADMEAAGAADPDAMLQHASALMSSLKFVEASHVLLRALALRPESAAAHGLLANALRDRGLKHEAVECLKTSAALAPKSLEVHSLLSFDKRHVCDWRDYEQDNAALSAMLSDAPGDAARMCATFGLLSLPLDPALQLAAARSEALAFAQGIEPMPAPRPGRQGQGAKTRLRLGFNSYDFRQHPVSQLLVEMLETLDRDQFEVLLYSTGPDDGCELRRRVVSAADRFIDLRGVSDQDAAQRIRDDGVDILLDLMGHTRGSRMGILARRPAPLQVAYLGFPASTGAPCIDYLIGDALVTPVELASLYSEKLAQMPLTFQPNGRWRPLPEPMSRAQAGLPDGAFVMCAFNHTYKIGPQAFDAWCQVMRDVPHAVLWLKETNHQLHENVQREARARGVDPQRIIWAKAVSYEDHFSRLALADVFVDTWPYNAHTTAADALWAGVPVVTVFGNGFASRVAASVLNAAGLAELAFETPQAYCAAITALALEPGLLAQYRGHLARRLALPLFDGARYTREFETLLQRMWARRQAGLPPEHLLAQPSGEPPHTRSPEVAPDLAEAQDLSLPQPF